MKGSFFTDEGERETWEAHLIGVHGWEVSYVHGLTAHEVVLQHEDAHVPGIIGGPTFPHVHLGVRDQVYPLAPTQTERMG